MSEVEEPICPNPIPSVREALAGCRPQWPDNDLLPFGGADEPTLKEVHYEWVQGLPRFGNEDDIANITTDWESYRDGLLSMSIFTTCIFALWWIVLIVARFLPSYKGGFLSGNMLKNSVGGTKLMVCRVLVFCSGIVVWVFSGLLISKALNSLTEVIKVVGQTLPVVIEILETATNATEEYVEKTYEAEAARVEFFDNISEHCEFGFPVGKIEDAVYTLNETLTNVSKNDGIANVSETMIFTTDILKTAEDSLHILNDGLVYTGVACVLLIDVLILVFLVTTGLRWYLETKGIHTRLASSTASDAEAEQPASDEEPADPLLPHLATLDKCNRYLHPFFAFTLIFTYIFSIICMLSSQVLTDVCHPNPAENIANILQAPWIAEELLKWYLGGCSLDIRPGWIPDFVWQIVFAVTGIDDFALDWFNSTDIGAEFLAQQQDDSYSSFTQAIADGGSARRELLPDVFSARFPLGLQCGITIEPVTKAWGFLRLKFTNLLELALGLLKTLRCDRIHVIYSKLINELACDKGLKTVGQMFVYLFWVAFFCMVMFTLRSSWNPPLKEEDDVNVEVEKKIMEEEDDEEADIEKEEVEAPEIAGNPTMETEPEPTKDDSEEVDN